jgi:hypothetical protein
VGNYPYRSGYVLNGGGELPAFPMRVACGYLAGSALTGDALLAGLRDAAGVFYNNTHDKKCYNISQGVNPATSDDGELWDYQFCTEMFQPMSRDGVKDAFFEQKFDEAAAVRDPSSSTRLPSLANVTARRRSACRNLTQPAPCGAEDGSLGHVVTNSTLDIPVPESSAKAWCGQSHSQGNSTLPPGGAQGRGCASTLLGAPGSACHSISRRSSAALQSHHTGVRLEGVRQL